MYIKRKCDRIHNKLVITNLLEKQNGGECMSIQEIVKIRNSGDEDANMKLSLAIHCAPILKGSKVANILTVTKEEFTTIGNLLEGTGISFCFLKTRGEKAILYLYRKKELETYLALDEIEDFLKEYDYKKGTVNSKLRRLSERICLYRSGKAEFPHEIGIFLGYPLMDVIGFIKNEGKNYVYCGYWKVYHNVQGTSRLFLRYDREREQVLNEISLGKSIREIAV